MIHVKHNPQLATTNTAEIVKLHHQASPNLEQSR